MIMVSFRVGCAAPNSDTYQMAIALAKVVFDVANKVGGACMRILNIRGGFMAGTQFKETTNAIKTAIETCFLHMPEPEVVGEPPRQGNFLPKRH